MKKWFVFIICCAIVVVLFVVKNSFVPKIYVKDYFGILGINEYGYTYGNAIRDFGSPKSTGIDENGCFIIEYGDFSMMFWSNNEDATLMNIKFFNNVYRFGTKNIGVGSSKEDVLGAYRGVKRSPDKTRCEYIDGNVRVEFIFTKEDIVSSMIICNGIL